MNRTENKGIFIYVHTRELIICMVFFVFEKKKRKQKEYNETISVYIQRER
jgi:hypothetical protein